MKSRNPKNIPTKTVGEAEVSAARKKAMTTIFADYPKLLGNYAGHMKYLRDGVEITDEAELFNEQKYVMELTFGLFINRIFMTRAAYELNAKAQFHLKLYQESFAKKIAKHCATDPSDENIFFGSQEAVTQAVLVYELSKGRDVLLMLGMEKEDPKADELLFWADFREVMKTILPAFVPLIDEIWDIGEMGLMFECIERGVKYQ